MTIPTNTFCQLPPPPFGKFPEEIESQEPFEAVDLTIFPPYQVALEKLLRIVCLSGNTAVPNHSYAHSALFPRNDRVWRRRNPPPKYGQFLHETQILFHCQMLK